jgi:hypothetical protein
LHEAPRPMLADVLENAERLLKNPTHRRSACGATA